MAKTLVSIAPGMETEAGQERIKEAMDRRQEATRQIVRLFGQVIKAVDYNPGKPQFCQIISDYYGDQDEGVILFERCKAAINEENAAHEAFLQALAGLSAQEASN